MKRLSLLVAMLLVATIGGVYAAFIYPGANGTATSTSYRTIYLEQSQQSGNIGDFTLASDIDKITLDQTYHDPELKNSDYTVKMITTFKTEGNKNPQVKLTFIPKAGANASIKSIGVDSYIYFGFVVNHTYDDPTTDAVENDAIFSVTYDKTHYITIHNTDYDGNLDDRNYIWNKELDGTFTVTLTHIDTVEEIVNLAKTFKLDTIEEYTKFRESMGDEFVNLVVTATTINPESV
ncbi:MAG: hypothetical protein J6V66_07210 [Clostridia bacterium]|nr:hypothetical protein [Clostridia bacterium]